MFRYLLALLTVAELSVGLAAAASAGDPPLPVQTTNILPPPAIQSAPVRSISTIPWNWSGLYLGGHVGGALSTTDIVDPFGVALFGDQVRSPGFVGGGQIGYNYQLSSVVFGIEADISGDVSDGTNTCFAVSGGTVSSNCRVRPDLYATLTGRLGYATGRSLLYAKGGLPGRTAQSKCFSTKITSAPGSRRGFLIAAAALMRPAGRPAPALSTH